MSFSEKEPVLVIMAAGLGSRYGGLKQIDPVDDAGRVILHYSLYDAAAAGFKKAVFIIRKEMEEDFKNVILPHVPSGIRTVFAYQELDKIPCGFEVPEGRKKPWGTGHAVLCAAGEIGASPFTVINADDYYGKEAFQLVFDHLKTETSGSKMNFAMAGYKIENTLTENGHVARGICSLDGSGYLKEITERTRIEKREDGAAFSLDGGASWEKIPEGTVVSMNFWGFSNGFLKELEKGFPQFLKGRLSKDPLTCEYYLPAAVDRLIREDKAQIKVFAVTQRWYGVTYKEDRETVVSAFRQMREAGLYEGL